MKKIYLFFILTSFFMVGCQNEDDSASKVDNPVKWDGATAESFDSDKEPFLISSPSQLKLLSDIVNGLKIKHPLGATDSSSYKLTKSIDLNYLEWTPIGSEASPFKGVFDGDNHTINGVFINTELGFQGLFGSIDGAVVKKINLNDCSITAGDFVINNDNNAAIVGYCKNGVVEECTFSGTFNNNGNAAGGIVGKVEGSKSSVLNCHCSGYIFASGGCRVGGIVGFNKDGLIEDCSNSAMIRGSGYYVGGIAGQSYNGSVINCFNITIVSGTSNIGGLVGVNMYGFVCNSFNTGDLYGYSGMYGENHGSTMGGITGFNSGALINCYNTGIINTPSREECKYIGGVVGNNMGNTTYCYYLKRCAVNAIGIYQNGVGSIERNTSVIDIDGSTNVFNETQGKALQENAGTKIGGGLYNNESALVDCLNAWQTANEAVRNRWTLTGSKTGYPVFVGVLNR
jgi:hypothetical protein